MVKRCFGSQSSEDPESKYHDTEWGVPSHDDSYLLEMLILEGAQAGLSWKTILKRRDAYKQAFHDFIPQKTATMSDHELENLLLSSNIIRNKLKIYSARRNAKVFIKIQAEFGSFDKYIWSFVSFKPIINNWKALSEIPTKSELSDIISKDLKNRGMNFVGSTIIYSYMQAIGLINDHTEECWTRQSN